MGNANNNMHNNETDLLSDLFTFYIALWSFGISYGKQQMKK